MGVRRDRHQARSCSSVSSHFPPQYAVSMVLEIIKKNTSRSLSRKFTFLEKVYWDQKGIWGKRYFVLTIGINEEVIRKYVQSQAKEETGQAKLEF